MASLSNINGLFDVHSTGAILFSTSHGTSGQILQSSGNAAPIWVNASTIIGGPYLPLSGGTLTGATSTSTGISFTIGGNLIVNGASATVLALSATTGSFSGNVTAPTFNGLAINTSGTNNVANQIVRTDSYGYVNFGWIQSTSGNHTGSITRITASGDAYLRYVTPAQFRVGVTDGYYAPTGTVSGVTSVSGTGTVSGITLTGTVTSTGNLTLGGTLSASITNISNAANWWNNFGQTHGTRTGFDASTASYDFGWRYIQGNTNGPGTGGTQFYSAYVGLGSEYPATGGGSYGMYLAIDRNITNPYLSIRYNEGNTLGTWKRISAGTADILTTARTIAGVSFNGSANISLNNNAITNGAGYTTNTGTVTSVATGNGLTGGTITSTGTLSLDRPNSQLGAVLATYGTTAGSSGRIRCTAPFNTNTGKMFSIEITLYGSYTQHNYVVSAYMYSTTNQWYSPKAIYTTTGTTTPDIIVGRDANGKAYISIANADYTGVLVHNMTRGYQTSLADTYDPWTITVNAGTENSVGVSTSQVWTTANHTPGNYLPLAGGTMANTNLVTNMNADLLDGQQGSYYFQTNITGNAATATTLQTNGAVSFTTDNSGFHVIGTESTGSNVRVGSAWSRPGIYNGSGTTAGGATNSITIGSENSIYFVTQNVERGRFDNSGIGYATASFRAPIFYDTNTAYYGDFAGQSSMYGVAVRGDLSSTATGNQIFFWGGGDSTTSAIGFKANGGNFVNPTGQGDGYNTYLTMDTPNRGWVFRRGTGGSNFTSAFNSGWILNTGEWQANTSMKAPIFYDSTNTGYYLDPAANSNLNTGKLAGRWSFDNYIVSGNEGGMMGSYNTTGTAPKCIWTIGESWPLANMYGLAYEYGAGYGHHLAMKENGTTYHRIGFSGPGAYFTGDTISSSSFKAPIFYDSANTAYYTRPASSSYINSLETAGSIQAGTSGTGNIYVGGTSSNYFRFHVNSAVGAATFFDMNSGNINWRQGSSTRYIFYSTTANMTIYGTLTQGSDIRIKENIVEISDCIDKVKSIRGVYYNRTDFNTEPTKIGVIAQEVEKQMPELVHDEPTTGIKSVSYTELTAILVNAIKEQQVIIDDLKLRIEKLEL
jgi:hypothetical protein